MELEHCDPLFERFLDPWYSSEDRKRKHFTATRPDILTADSYRGTLASELSILGAEGDREVIARIDRMLAAVRKDWPGYLPVSGDIDETWIDAFDEYYDRDRVSEVVRRSEPSDFTNDYLILVCEFGAALGYVLKAKEPRLDWLYDWPYWESSLVDTGTGAIIPPFHCAVKKFSDYGVEDGFVPKIEMCLEALNESRG